MNRKREDKKQAEENLMVGCYSFKKATLQLPNENNPQFTM